jgi:hypothetical protein
MTKSERFIKEIEHHQEGMTASTRREESLDLTVHGIEFETMVCRQLQDACQMAGDIPSYIGHTIRFGSIWIPVSYAKSTPRRGMSSPLPRMRALCMNWKNPRYSGSFS